MGFCKCNGAYCNDLKISCYRYRKIGSDYQSYAMLYEPHPNDPSIKCVNFVAIEGRKDLKELNHGNV